MHVVRPRPVACNSFASESGVTGAARPGRDQEGPWSLRAGDCRRVGRIVLGPGLQISYLNSRPQRVQFQAAKSACFTVGAVSKSWSQLASPELARTECGQYTSQSRRILRGRGKRCPGASRVRVESILTPQRPFLRSTARRRRSSTQRKLNRSSARNMLSRKCAIKWDFPSFDYTGMRAIHLPIRKQDGKEARRKQRRRHAKRTVYDAQRSTFNGSVCVGAPR